MVKQASPLRIFFYPFIQKEVIRCPHRTTASPLQADMHQSTSREKKTAAGLCPGPQMIQITQSSDSSAAWRQHRPRGGGNVGVY